MTIIAIVQLCDFSVSGQLVKSCVRTYVGTMYYMAVSRRAINIAVIASFYEYFCAFGIDYTFYP